MQCSFWSRPHNWFALFPCLFCFRCRATLSLILLATLGSLCAPWIALVVARCSLIRGNPGEEISYEFSIESPSMTILREYHSRWEGLVEIQVLRTPPKVLAWRSWNWPVLIGGAWMKAHVTLAGCSSEVLAKDILLNSFRRSFYDDVAGFLRRSCLKGLDISWPSSCRGWCAKILWKLYWNRFRGPCMNWRCLSEMLIWKLLWEAFRIFLSKDLVGPLEGPPMTIWQGSLCLKVLTKFS